MSPAILQAAPGRAFNPIGFEPPRQRQRRAKAAPDVRILVPDVWTAPEGLTRRHAEQAAWLMSQVACAFVFGHRVKAGFVHLKYDILVKMFSDDKQFQAIRAALIEKGDLVCDGKYGVGRKALGYKLGPRCAGAKLRRRPVADTILARKILARREVWCDAPAGVHRHLLGWLRALEIDAEAALSWLALDPDYQPSDETAVHMLSGGDLHFSVDDFGRRVHTNATNLPGRLRGFLHYGGTPLVNLDIRNSQPLILGMVILDDRRGKGPVEDDVRRYVESCESGRFYEHMMDAAYVMSEDSLDFKRTVFGSALFCRLPTPYVPEREQATLLRQLFPTVHAVAWAKRSGPEKDAYKALSRELQRTESDIMIHGVCKKLMAEAPHIPVWTIHDSILTTPDHAAEVKARIAAEFTLRGVRPEIKVENLTRPEC